MRGVEKGRIADGSCVGSGREQALLREGKNREVRNVMAALGCEVTTHEDGCASLQSGLFCARVCVVARPIRSS